MSSTPSGVTPKGRQYRTTEEERDHARVKGLDVPEETHTQWRIEALQEGEDGREWVTVGFCLPLPAGQFNWDAFGYLVDTKIDARNSPYSYVFTGLWVPAEVA
jgi:hypothetical protein